MIERQVFQNSWFHYVESFEACYQYEKAMAVWVDCITDKRKSNTAARCQQLVRKYGKLIAAELQSSATPLNRKTIMKKARRVIVRASKSCKTDQPFQHLEKLDRVLEKYFKKVALTEVN
jgi:hypothetical protein